MSRVVSGNIAAFDDTSYTPLRDGEDRGPNQPARSRLASRRQTTSAQLTGGLTPGTGGGGWIEPITWQDGAIYGEQTLNEQLEQNVRNMPHLLKVLEEEITVNANIDTDLQTIEQLTLPLGANEVWVLTWVCAVRGDPDANPSSWAPFITLFAGAVANGVLVYNGNGATNVEDGLIKYGGTQSFGPWDDLPNATTTSQIVVLEMTITGTASAGSILFTINSTSGTTIVMPGTCVFGMRVVP